MDIIVDANLMVALVTQHLHREAVYRQFEHWADQGATLHAPDLAYSEVTNALTRMISAGLFSREQSQAVCEELAGLLIRYHSLGFDSSTQCATNLPSSQPFSPGRRTSRPFRFPLPSGEG